MIPLTSHCRFQPLTCTAIEMRNGLQEPSSFSLVATRNDGATCRETRAAPEPFAGVRATLSGP